MRDLGEATRIEDFAMKQINLSRSPTRCLKLSTQNVAVERRQMRDRRDDISSRVTDSVD